MPPDGVLAGLLLDEELVLRRPARVLAGLGGQGSGGDDGRLIPANRLFVKGGGTEIAPFDSNLTLRDHDLTLLRDACASGAGPPPLLAAHVVDQDVLAEPVWRDEERATLVDSRHL